MTPKTLRAGLCALGAALVLAACGGGGSASIGGEVSGLAAGASVTLQDNNGDNLTLAADQGFTFAKPVDEGAAYAVTVLSQPVGETCLVGNGVGTVDSSADNVTDVTVTCTQSSSVGVTVQGLGLGQSVWLANNGQVLALASNGSFAFPGLLAAGSGYAVTVTAQPAQQNCVLSNASGVVPATGMAQVGVTCS